MKKIISLAIALSITVSMLCLGGIGAAAYFGLGAQVVANDVNMIKTALIGQKICFTDGDFKSALVLSDFDSITITEIPASTEGTLLLSGRRVGKGRVIKRKNLGGLVFIPASDSVKECSFKFTVDGYAGGAEIECVLKFIDKVNYAPETTGDTVSTASISTQESISVYGNLGATDPEGDEIEYIIVTYPGHGILTITEQENGRYCYTPTDGYVGKDKFTYVVRDEYGNYSKPVSVSVRITKRMSDVVYRDMVDREEYNAAVAMTAMGIMSGVQLGDDQYFHPDERVTRAEFVAMAMKCAGIRVDSTLSGTYFDDDEDISVSLKGYIATAQRAGIINGDFKDGKLVFSPNEEITRYEAAKILATMLGVDAEGEESVFATDNDIPVWARAGVYAMCSMGVFDDSDSSSLTETITRGDVAEYLYRISKI
ncbi:MAG: S-layer homology domain-containing protein [Clostridia bacterium]|nr:S-layer homology domain-containing protein [Clostridia bacterium]